MVAVKGAAKKLKEGEKPKEGAAEAEKEFLEAYDEVEGEVKALE